MLFSDANRVQQQQEDSTDERKEVETREREREREQGHSLYVYLLKWFSTFVQSRSSCFVPLLRTLPLQSGAKKTRAFSARRQTRNILLSGEIVVILKGIYTWRQNELKLFWRSPRIVEKSDVTSWTCFFSRWLVFLWDGAKSWLGESYRLGQFFLSSE